MRVGHARRLEFEMQASTAHAGSFAMWSRWPALLLFLAAIGLMEVGTHVVGRRPFPPDTTPEGAYARVALAVAERRPSDAFAYLETEAQWAAFTIHDARKRASERVRQSYPSDEQPPILAGWNAESSAADGPETFARLAQERGWIHRLERDMSGVAHVDVSGARATVVTSRGTRYPFRRRENGIWGLTLFTAELQAEAERATRDLQMVDRAADDYDRGKAVTR